MPKSLGVTTLFLVRLGFDERPRRFLRVGFSSVRSLVRITFGNLLLPLNLWSEAS